jgi:hypothetical protein
MVGASISAILGSEAKSAVVILNPMHDLLSELRGACAAVAGRARYVSIHRDAIEPFAASLPTVSDPAPPDPEVHLVEGTRSISARAGSRRCENAPDAPATSRSRRA